MDTKKNAGKGKKKVDNAEQVAVTSDTVQGHGNDATITTQEKKMSLTLVRSTAKRKSERLVIYNIEGRKGSVQFLSTLFGGDQKSQGNPPATLVIEGEFAAPKAPKEKLTPEERKARLAALPKLTLAEKVAKAEERTAKMKAKLMAQQAKAAAVAQQPELATV